MADIEKLGEAVIGQQFLSALINGDTSGLDDIEEALFDDWYAETVSELHARDWYFNNVDDSEDEFGFCEITGWLSRPVVTVEIFGVPVD